MATTVTDNADDHRYELHVDSGGRTEFAGLITYRVEPEGVVAFLHTEVFDEFAGKGLAGVLVKGALDDLRQRGLRVRAVCPYVKAWLPKHPDYADLAA